MVSGSAIDAQSLLRLTVHQTELGHDVADVRMAVEWAGHTVCRPTRMRHGRLAEEDLVHVDCLSMAIAVAIAIGYGRNRSGDGIGDVLAKGGNLTDLFEEDDGSVWGVSVDPNA